MAPNPLLRSKELLLGLLAMTLVFAGSYALAFVYDSSEDQALELVPADAIAYGNVFLDPSNNQKRALEALLRRFPAAGTPEQARKQFLKLLDEGLRELDMTFEEDVEPWLGDQVAGFALITDDFQRPFEGAALVQTHDAAATESFLDDLEDSQGEVPSRGSYKGVDYEIYQDEATMAIYQGFLIVGTERALRAVIDTHQSGKSLAGAARFRDATRLVEDDVLAQAYFDGRRVAEVFTAAAGLPPSGSLIQLQQPLAASVYARPDGIVLESAGRLPESGPFARLMRTASDNGLLEEVPADSWGALGVARVGQTLEVVLDEVGRMGVAGFAIEAFKQQLRAETTLDIEKDLLGWIGDIGLFVTGTDPALLQGGVIIETTDRVASTLAIKKLFTLAVGGDVPARPLPLEGAEGFTIRDRTMQEALNVAAAGNRVVVAYGDAATARALRADAVEKLRSTAMYVDAKRSLGEGFTITGLLDLEQARKLAENFGLASEPEYLERIQPNLAPLSHIVFGSKIQNDVVIQRVVIGVR